MKQLCLFDGLGVAALLIGELMAEQTHQIRQCDGQQHHEGWRRVVVLPGSRRERERRLMLGDGGGYPCSILSLVGFASNMTLPLA
ncbi:hypothetical protein E2562_020336 [Oryza meyeriana var. granulata]|uniref:Secreted protein n=1 Tax=Oryza meyeriana var. granulata TaxID=110450 RepID=A0A6G1EBB3_9ORYZ|nr:hypothetical protein E2562_020336 [Oryza meyeriana var. granulata]